MAYGGYLRVQSSCKHFEARRVPGGLFERGRATDDESACHFQFEAELSNLGLSPDMPKQRAYLVAGRHD